MSAKAKEGGFCMKKEFTRKEILSIVLSSIRITIKYHESEYRHCRFSEAKNFLLEAINYAKILYFLDVITLDKEKLLEDIIYSMTYEI